MQPKWLTARQWKSLPEVLQVRELRYRVMRPGDRVREITLITTLLDAQRYPFEALAELYHQRWTIETNFRHLTITLGMDQLHCQTDQLQGRSALADHRTLTLLTIPTSKSILCAVGDANLAFANADPRSIP